MKYFTELDFWTPYVDDNGTGMPEWGRDLWVDPTVLTVHSGFNHRQKVQNLESEKHL
jgi:hypothetical protein